MQVATFAFHVDASGLLHHAVIVVDILQAAGRLQPFAVACNICNRKLIVVEELDPVIETFVRGLGLKCEIHGKDMFPICGEFSQNLVAAAFGKEVPQGKKLDGVQRQERPARLLGYRLARI